MLGRRILVPLDGSPFGRRALPLATEIASRTEGTIHLVSVKTPWPLTDVPPAASTVIGDVDQGLTEGLERHLADAADSLRRAGIEARTELRVGMVEDEILDACDATGCDLIAMSTHGRGGFQRLWLGSVADRVARHAHVPVLLVPARDEEGDEGGNALAELATDATATAIRTVIVPLDGSEFAEQALAPATAIGEMFGADYVLFRAVPPRLIVGSPYMAHAVHVEKELLEIERAAAKRDLEVVSDRLAESGYRSTVTLSEQAEPVDALLRLANGEQDAMVVMTTHGRGGLRRAILGSTADKVIRGARRPILLVRPEQTEQDR